jgi:hypothetical protein
MWDFGCWKYLVPNRDFQMNEKEILTLFKTLWILQNRMETSGMEIEFSSLILEVILKKTILEEKLKSTCTFEIGFGEAICALSPL